MTTPRIPLGINDVPPGSVLRVPSTDRWSVIVGASRSDIILPGPGDNTLVKYDDEQLMELAELSTDQGKTWRPFYHVEKPPQPVLTGPMVTPVLDASWTIYSPSHARAKLARRQIEGGALELAYYCEHCELWIDGEPDRVGENTIGPMSGRSGTVTNCRRCKREIDFQGMIS